MATVEQDITLGRIVGTPVERKEDTALLTGQAQFVDDMSVPGMVWMAVVRSPYAHARIESVDVTPALAHRGVIAAFSGEELAGEWQASLPCAWLPTEDTKAPPHFPIASDKARYEGDAVAVVVASSRASFSFTSCASGSDSPGRTSAATRLRVGPAPSCWTESPSSRARCSASRRTGTR